MQMVSEEIRKEVGAENFLLFGLTAEQVYLVKTGRSGWSELISRSGGLTLGELEHSLP